ncbi:MAG: glycosyltransferase family 39 protein [Owenweeksia sp.]|nr:glycosyltransferase family 39 protein [Owenweeksia sp.]
MLWGGALRWYRFWEIPFTHDELSALLRLPFDSFPELIRKGVYPDNHPPAVQVFLYYYTGILGTSEWIFKLPFVLMGWLSIYLLYRIGKCWGNAQAGLLAASVMACSQYLVMYSQIARPYSFGLFMVLAAVLFWSYYLRQARRWHSSLAGWVLLATLACYSHHLSLLAIFMIALTGLIFTTRAQRWPYILAAVLVFVLYLPNLPVFWIQLQRGGLSEWLSPPSTDFFANYLSWVFHFSPWYAGAFIVSVLLSWIWAPRQWPGLFFIMGFSWFVTTVLIAYLYSVKVAPVLQYSLLIFTFPFALLLAFAGAQFQKKWILVTLCLLLLGTGTLSLVFGRKHYQIHYENAYEESFQYIQKNKDQYPDALVWLTGRADINQVYLEKYNLDQLSPTMITDTTGLALLLKELKRSNARHIFLSANQASNPALVAMAKYYFPRQVFHGRYRNGEFFHFSTDGQPTHHFYSRSEKIPGCRLNATTEYACVHDVNSVTNTSGIDSDGYLDVVAEVISDKPLQAAELSLAVYRADTIAFWRSVPLESFYPLDSSLTYPAFLGSPLYLFELQPGDRVRCLIWNRAGEHFKVKEMTLHFRPANPVLYRQYLPFNMD